MQIDFEKDVLAGLEFDFTASLKSKTPYAHKLGVARIRYHRQFEIQRNQFTLVAIFLARIYAKVGWQQPATAILSPDLNPETSEVLASAVAELMVKQGLEMPILLTRRKDFEKNGLSFTSLAPWHDENLLSKFDLVLIVSSNANFNIVHEILPHQKNIEKTIFFSACGGMEYARAKNLLKIELLVLPFCLFDEFPEDSKVLQNVDFEKLLGWEQGPRLSDLPTIKKTILSHLVGKGMNENDAAVYILQTVPATEIEGIEKADGIIGKRLHYIKRK